MTELVEVNRCVVFPWNCDQYGHMNVRWYAHHFDDGAYQLWSIHGISTKELCRRNLHDVIANTSTNFIKETKVGDILVINGGFTHVGSKSVHHHLIISDTDTGEVRATQDVVAVFFDAEKRCSAAIPDDIRGILESVVVQLKL